MSLISRACKELRYGCRGRYGSPNRHHAGNEQPPHSGAIMQATRAKTTARICASAAIVVLMTAAGTGTATAQDAGSPFKDVDSDHLFGDEISTLVDTGVLDQSDTANGKFDSGAPVHPGDMTRWMSNLADKYDVDTTIIDITSAAMQGQEQLNRNSAAAIFSNFFDLPRDVKPHSFSDVPSFSANSVSAMQADGITNGCGQGAAYCGTRTFTRGHAAAFMGRFVEKYGNSRAHSTSSGYSDANIRSYYNARAYVNPSSTASSTPFVSCSVGHHGHVSTPGPGIPARAACHTHASSVPACSGTAGNNQNYNIHVVGGSHNSGSIPSCPAPQTSLNHPELQLEVTAGQTPMLVLQAAPGAQVTRKYDITLAPHEQSEAMQTWCATPAGAGSASTMCTTSARPGLDYAVTRWESVEIGPGLPLKTFSIVDPDTGMPAPPRLSFGDQPREFEIIVTDSENPAVSKYIVVTINPPAIGSG